MAFAAVKTYHPNRLLLLRLSRRLQLRFRPEGRQGRHVFEARILGALGDLRRTPTLGVLGALRDATPSNRLSAYP